jgi:hypothetical protein
VTTESRQLTVYPTDAQRETLRQMGGIIKKVNKEAPDPKAMAELRAAMDRAPDIWRLFFDVGERTTENLAEMCSKNGLITESIRRGCISLRADLAYDTAPPLERGLIEQVVQAWLTLQIVQQEYARTMVKSVTLKQGEYWERRLNSAQYRYLRACETLARVRKMLAPTMQLNVARQQVNIGGPQVNIATCGSRTVEAAAETIVEGTAEDE